LKQAKLNQELKSKLEAFESQQKAAEAERQKALLEETGNYKALLEQKEKEIQEVKQSFQRELQKEKLSKTLLAKGLTNPLAQKLALMDYDYETDPEEYADSIISNEDFSIFFNQTSPEKKPLPNGVSPARSTSVNWEQVKADLTCKDKSKRDNADKLIRDHMAKTGQMPF
jgi:translation elongation factor EF-G